MSSEIATVPTTTPMTEKTSLVLSHGASSLGEESLHHDLTNSKRIDEDVPLYSRPRQRQRWDDTQVLPHVNWGDLFYDLFSVGAAYNLAVILKESPSFLGLLYFVCCYLAVVMMWGEKTVYDARFAPEDNLFHRAVDVMYILLMATAIQHIRPIEIMAHTSTNLNTFAFFLGLGLATFVDQLRYRDVIKNVEGGEEATHTARHEYTRKFFSMGFYTLGALLALYDYVQHYRNHAETEGEVEYQDHERENHIPILCCLGAYLGEVTFTLVETFYLLPKWGRHFKQVRVPINVEFTLHRYGEWIMLMLGESVLALLIVEQSEGSRYYVTFYTGIFSVTMMQYLYFRSQPFEAADHAMRRSQWGGYQFYYAMLGYSASLIIIGCSFKLILHHYLDEEAVVASQPIPEDEPQYSLEESARRIADMFSWSLALSFFFLDLSMIAHRGWKGTFSRLRGGGRERYASVLMFLNGLIMVLMATLSQWVTSLQLLSVLGAVFTSLQAAMRTLAGRLFFTRSGATPRWPNWTEPQSIPAGIDSAT